MRIFTIQCFFPHEKVAPGSVGISFCVDDDIKNQLIRGHRTALCRLPGKSIVPTKVGWLEEAEDHQNVEGRLLLPFEVRRSAYLLFIDVSKELLQFSLLGFFKHL